MNGLAINQAQTGPRAFLAKAQIALALGGSGLAAEAAIAPDAHANEGVPSPIAQLAGATAVAPETEAQAPVVTSELTGFTINAASSEAHDAAADSARVVLAYRRAKGTPKKEAKKMEDQCYIDTGFYNSGTVLGKSPNTPAFFWDKGTAIICRNSKSPTGYVKVGIPKNKNVLKDGYQKRDVKPGTDCYNIVGGKKKPKKIVPTPIVVRSFNETIKVNAQAKAVADAYCGPNASAHAEATAQASAKLTVREVVRSRGAVFNQVKGEAKANAAAEASAKASCVSVTGNNPNTPNLPPSVEVDQPNHIAVNGIIAFCEREKDVDGTIATREFKVLNGGGSFITNVYEGNDDGEFCRDYKAPSTSTSTSGKEVTLGVTVRDNLGAPASAQTEPFPVVDIPK